MGAQLQNIIKSFILSYATIFRNIPNPRTSPSSIKLKSAIAENSLENRIDFSQSCKSQFQKVPIESSLVKSFLVKLLRAFSGVSQKTSMVRSIVGKITIYKF